MPRQAGSGKGVGGRPPDTRESAYMGGLSAGAPLDLFLCESQKLVLRPGVIYRFGVDPGCDDCKRIEREGDVNATSRHNTAYGAVPPSDAIRRVEPTDSPTEADVYAAIEDIKAAGAPLCKCGHAESMHIATYWPTPHVECRAGGIIEPDDVGWQCKCRRFRSAGAPTDEHPAITQVTAAFRAAWESGRAELHMWQSRELDAKDAEDKAIDAVRKLIEAAGQHVTVRQRRDYETPSRPWFEERIATLERENADLVSELDVVAGERDAALREVEALRAELQEAKALRPYVQHYSSCRAVCSTVLDGDTRCDCGLQAVLDERKEAS